MEPSTEVPSSGPGLPRKGWTLLSWVVILAAVSFIVGSRFVPIISVASSKETQTEKLGLIVETLQLRCLIGVRAFLQQYAHLGIVKDESTEKLYEQAEKLNRGTIDQRLRFVPVAGELRGPKEALAQIARLGAAGARMTAPERKVATILDRLYRDYTAGRFDHPSVDAQEEEFLVVQLEWFGQLALHPSGSDPAARDAALEPAVRTAIALMSATAVIVVGGLAGLLGLVLLASRALSGAVRPALTLDRIGHGGVYAETFALWLVGYFGLTFVAGWLLDGVPMLVRAAAAMLLSLGVVGWPVLRGIPWSEVRRDIGWTPGQRSPLHEIGAGLLGYILCLPLVLVGFSLTVLALRLQERVAAAQGDDFSGTHLPAHPILQFLANPDLASVVLIFLLASAIAPIVEETMFRGVLYRHLRELTLRAGPFASAVASTLVVSFLFAAIHPQGLVAIPVLMSLACGFCILREWRGTVLPSAIAHGLNNALVTCLALTALSP